MSVIYKPTEQNVAIFVFPVMKYVDRPGRCYKNEYTRTVKGVQQSEVEEIINPSRGINTRNQSSKRSILTSTSAVFI